MAVTLGTGAAGITYNDTSTESSAKSPVRAIFGYGYIGSATGVSMTNLVNNYGGVAKDTTGVGTTRFGLAGAGYGGDKAIFAYGYTYEGSGGYSAVSNLVSNLGVVAGDTTGVGTARYYLAGAGYGGDKAIVGFGVGFATVGVTNLISNTGVVATDTAAVGTARSRLGACSYGGDKAIFAFGNMSPTLVSIATLVSNVGVVTGETTYAGINGRHLVSAASYGGDKGIFGFSEASISGVNTVTAITNLISNLGVIAADVSGVGTARYSAAAAGYGGDKAIFGFGYSGSATNITNLVSNTGVVTSNVTGVGTSRWVPAAASYSS